MSALDSLYQEVILDHSKRPIGKGELEAAADALTASHHEFNPSCGDEIDVSIAVDPESGKVTSLAWEGQGCSISMASASILSQLLREEQLDAAASQARIDAFREMIQGKNDTPDEELLGDAVALQGVSKFVMRVKCAMLAWVAFEADLRQIEAAK